MFWRLQTWFVVYLNNRNALWWLQTGLVSHSVMGRVCYIYITCSHSSEAFVLGGFRCSTIKHCVSICVSRVLNSWPWCYDNRNVALHQPSVPHSIQCRKVRTWNWNWSTKCIGSHGMTTGQWNHSAKPNCIKNFHIWNVFLTLPFMVLSLCLLSGYQPHMQCCRKGQGPQVNMVTNHHIRWGSASSRLNLATL